MNDLTIIYYTSNFLDDTNPYFLANTRKELLNSVVDYAIVSVSHKPIILGENICVGDIGRSNRNIYWQILQGTKVAKTKYVAMAEDDVLYLPEHFAGRPKRDAAFLYNMNKWSIFTWSKPMQFSWRPRMIIFSLICDRLLLIDTLEEHLAACPAYDTQWCGEPGRYERQLGVTVHETEQWCSGRPIIVFSHPYALGYISTPHGRTRPAGERKAMGDVRAHEILPWGTAQQVMKLWDKDWHE